MQAVVRDQYLSQLAILKKKARNQFCCSQRYCIPVFISSISRILFSRFKGRFCNASIGLSCPCSRCIAWRLVRSSLMWVMLWDWFLLEKGSQHWEEFSSQYWVNIVKEKCASSFLEVYPLSWGHSNFEEPYITTFLILFLFVGHFLLYHVTLYSPCEKCKILVLVN